MNRSAWLVIFSIILVVCSSPTVPTSQPVAVASKPQVIISNPPSGLTISTGADFSVQSTSSDPQGISKVELIVDNQSVRLDAIPTGNSQPQFQVLQTWKATNPGTHTVVVRATNEKGATGEAALSVTVAELPKPTSTPLPAPTTAPTLPPPPTSAPVATKAAAPTIAPTPAPTAVQSSFSIDEAQMTDIANGALSPAVIYEVDTASARLVNGQAEIKANFNPINSKPSIAVIVFSANAVNCVLRISVAGATFGYFGLPEPQRTILAQSFEQIIQYRLTQQRTVNCIDSVAIGNGAMTIIYH